MRRLIGPRWQTALVVVLFLGSLAVLLYNLFASLSLPQQELRVRGELQEAGRRMSEAAEALSPEAADDTSAPALNPRLRDISARVLADYPGVEGGFYVSARSGVFWFGGYAYPTTSHPHDEAVTRNDPPPLETPYIRAQLRDSLDEGTSILRTEDVAASRVVILTAPVGKHWPPRLTVWLMYRLTGPEQLASQVRGYAISTGLALGGVALALFLTWSLTRSLRRQRQEQDRLRDDLRRAEHLAGLGKLLAGVAHEVRNPLAALRSTVQLWQRLTAEARTPASLEAVVGAVDRLNALVGRLLFFARADNAQREPVDLNQLLGESLDLVQAQAAGQGVTVERAFSADLPPVLGSPAALRQVVLNLLTNALQAMPRGGRLCCASHRLDAPAAVEVRITDTGPGVAVESRGHLFEPFYTTRPDGTGLGLALCREILANHDGQIELMADETSGACFRFTIPTSDARNARP
jgi:two-component system, NtrC family, sensor histidine kinase HydH